MDVANTASGLQSGVIDRVGSTVSDAILDADLIVVAVPVLAMTEVFTNIKDGFDSPDVTITDVGSVKHEVLNALRQIAGKVPENFVPGHPIAGSEKHGVAAADADLFRKHKVILTPLANTSDDCTLRITRMWQSFGAAGC